MKNHVSLFLILTLFLVSCKKSDFQNIDKSKINSDFKINLFFQTPENTNSVVLKFISFLEKENHKKGFIQKIIKNDGYAVWDKAIVYNNLKTQNTIGEIRSNSLSVSNTSNKTADTLLYIPLVLENTKYVYSFIYAKLNGDSVSWKVFSGRDYDKYPSGNPDSDEITSDKLALITMLLEKETFNHTRFLLTDTSLFKQKNTKSNGNKRVLEFVNPQISSDKVIANRLVTVDFFYSYNLSHCTCNNPYYCDKCPDCITSVTVIMQKTLNIPDAPSGGGGSGGSSQGGGNSNPNNNGNYPINSGDGSTDSNDPCDPNSPCGKVGWTAEQELANYLATDSELGLNLNFAEKSWLTSHPAEAVSIYEFLEDNLNLDPIDEYNSPTSPQEEAKLAVKITLASAMNNMIEGPYDNAHWDIISPYIPNGQTTANMPPNWWALLKMKAAFHNSVIIGKSAFQVFLEITHQNIHTSLDVMGLVPGIGEIADITNGIIYTVKGQGVNASLSFASVIPFAGWAAAATKYAGKTIDAVNGGKTTLLWIKKTDGTIDFGRRENLRKIIGLGKGNKLIAHHLIPWEHSTDLLVQRAAISKNPFHMNDLGNGLPVKGVQHNNGGHSIYNSIIKQKLTNLWNLNGGSNMSTETAEALLNGLISDIKAWILAHPNESINNIVL